MVGIVATFSVPDRSGNPFRMRAGFCVDYGGSDRRRNPGKNLVLGFVAVWISALVKTQGVLRAGFYKGGNPQVKWGFPGVAK